MELPEPGQPVTGALAQLEPLSLQEVSAEPATRAWVKEALARFHYLGFGGAVGENLQYVVRDGQNRPLACLVFGAAAWKCQDRDRFIGWTAEQRQKHLALVANNTRFLILPWVRVPDLGSWILGRVAGRIARDWQAKYGHRVVVLETFVERNVSGARFIGRPTGSGWGGPRDAPARIGIPASRWRQRTFMFIRCAAASGRCSKDEDAAKKSCGSWPTIRQVAGICSGQLQRATGRGIRP